MDGKDGDNVSFVIDKKTYLVSLIFFLLYDALDAL